MALEDLFPGRRTPEQERFLDTLFYHTGFWYATDVAGTEEAFVRDGFSRRKQAPPSSFLDRVAELFGRQSSQPVHEHYAEPGFQIVSTRVLSPRYVTALAADLTVPRETAVGVTAYGIPSQAALSDGGNEGPIVEFILSTQREDQAPDGTYRFSSFGLVVPASERAVVQALVDHDPTLLDHIKREMFPAWEAQYPSVAVGAEVHGHGHGHHEDPHGHGAHHAPHRDHRLADLSARLDRLQDRVAEFGVRFSQPLDLDGIYNRAYATAGATVAVPPYEAPRPAPIQRPAPEPRREPEHHAPSPDRYAGRVAVPIKTPEPAPEPQTEPYIRSQPAPRPAPVVPVAPPRAPEPRVPPPAPYEPSPEDARRRADYLASLRRPAEEPQTPIQPYVPPQPSPERAQVVAEARAGARSVEDYLAGLQRTKSALTPAPTSPVATPEKVYRYTLEVDDINPNSGDFPGRTYTIIREGSRVRFEGDFLDAMEANLLGAVDLDVELEQESPFVQYTEQGAQPHYRYRELVDTILESEPRPTSDFFEDLFYPAYLGLDPNDARIYTHHHLLVANMPQTPTSRMGTEKLAILGRVVKIEELPPDYQRPITDPAVLELRQPEAPTQPYVAPSTTVRSALGSELDALAVELFTEEELDPDALDRLFSGEPTPAPLRDAVPLVYAEDQDRVPTLTPAPEAREVTREITRSMVVPRREGEPTPETLDDALAKNARDLGYRVAFDDAHPVPSDMAEGHFGGAAGEGAPAEYEMTTRDVLSTHAVQEEVGRRTDASARAEALFNEGVRLFEEGNLVEAHEQLRAAYHANPIYLEWGRRLAKKVGEKRGGVIPDVMDAVRLLTDIIIVEPTYAHAFADRAFFQMKQVGRGVFSSENRYPLSGALTDIARACELEPGNDEFKEQKKEIENKALNSIARNARLYRVDCEKEGFGLAPDTYSPVLVAGSHCFYYWTSPAGLSDNGALVGSIGVKGWMQKTRKRHVQELIETISDELKDPATPILEYQAFVSDRVRLAKEGKSYSPEPRKGEYLIIKDSVTTSQLGFQAVFSNCGRIVSHETAYDKKGREKSEWIADIEQRLRRHYEEQGVAIPFADLLVGI